KPQWANPALSVPRDLLVDHASCTICMSNASVPGNAVCREALACAQCRAGGCRLLPRQFRENTCPDALEVAEHRTDGGFRVPPSNRVGDRTVLSNRIVGIGHARLREQAEALHMTADVVVGARQEAVVSSLDDEPMEALVGLDIWAVGREVLA